MNTRTLLLNLSPLAGRGRIALSDPGEGVQVSRHRHSRIEPLTPTLSPQARGEGAKLSSPGLTGRSSTPRPISLIERPLEYWIPAFAGMTIWAWGDEKETQTQC